MLAKVNIKLTDRDKKLLIVLAMIAVLTLGYLTIFQWYVPEHARLKADVDLLEVEVAKLALSLEAVKQLEIRLKDSLIELEQERKRFEWQVLQGEPILTLKDEPSVESIHFTSFNHGTADLVGSIQEVTYFMVAKGHYEEILNYLTHLDSQEKPFQINRLSLVFPNSFTFNLQDEIQLEMELAAFGDSDYQGLFKQDLSWLDGRYNIFEPSVYAPPIIIPSESVEQPANPVNSPDNDSSSLQESIELPRYKFPTEEEVNQWKQR